MTSPLSLFQKKVISWSYIATHAPTVSALFLKFNNMPRKTVSILPNVTIGSNAGKEIVEHTVVKEVPTAVYLGTQPNGPIYTTMKLMHTDGTLDTHTLDVMQQLKQNNE